MTKDLTFSIVTIPKEDFDADGTYTFEDGTVLSLNVGGKLFPTEADDGND